VPYRSDVGTTQQGDNRTNDDIRLAALPVAYELRQTTDLLVLASDPNALAKEFSTTVEIAIKEAGLMHARQMIEFLVGRRDRAKHGSAITGAAVYPIARVGQSRSIRSHDSS
jgi:hypothetical protein